MTLKKQIFGRGIRIQQVLDETGLARMTIDRISAGQKTTEATANMILRAMQKLANDPSLTYQTLNIEIIRSKAQELEQA